MNTTFSDIEPYMLKKIKDLKRNDTHRVSSGYRVVNGGLKRIELT